MRKSARSLILKSGLVALALSLNFFAACEIGLGSSVDTEAPKIDFADETVAAGAVVRDAFAVFGTFDDDGSIDSVKATLTNLSTSEARKKDGELLSGKKWRVSFNPAEEGIKDGSYELVIVIKDTAKHDTKITRAFTIDNTAPLVVLSRPSTKNGASSFDSYGQKFTLEGKAADDNDVSLIEVNVYSDPSCSGTPLKTISIPNVPLTIETDVAEYDEKKANDYSVIYGHVDASGIALKDGTTEKRYCKLVVYDGAQRYPADGSAQSEEDKKGNSIDHYYLSGDEQIANLFTAGYKITELYHILNGNYSGSASRSISTSSVVELLASPEKQVTCGQFSLNPENSPHFVVSARNTLEDGHTLDETPITNGNSQLEVEIAPGLDGYIILKDTVGVYLVSCDLNGNPLKSDGTIAADEKEANKICLIKEGDAYHKTQDEVDAQGLTLGKEYGIYSVSGSTYKFKTAKNISVDDYGLNVGDNYYVYVTGKDQQGNSIMSDGKYGFQLITSGKNIEVGVTVTPEWLSTNPDATLGTSVSVKLTYATENKPFEIYSGKDKNDLKRIDNLDANGALNPNAAPVEISPYIDSTIDISSEPKTYFYQVKGKDSAVSNIKEIELKYDDKKPQQPTFTRQSATEDSISFKGAAKDDGSDAANNKSGIEDVYIEIWDNADTSIKVGPILASNSASKEEWSFEVAPTDNSVKAAFETEGEKTAKVTIVDKVGLKNSATKVFTYDTTAPVLTSEKYALGTVSAATLKDFDSNGKLYLDEKNNLTVYGKCEDPGSGIESFGLKLKNADLTATIKYSTEEPAAGSNLTTLNYDKASLTGIEKTVKYWKAEISSSKFDSKDKCGDLSVNAKNGAGKSTTTKIVTLIFDDAAPVLSNVSFTSSNTKKPTYKKSETASEIVYYVYNKDDNGGTTGTTPKFTISGMATDAVELKSVKLTVAGNSVSLTSSPDNLSDWEFANIDLKSYGESATVTAVITAEDYSGRSDSKTLKIKFDITKPKAMHWADSKNKDIYFRIGNADNDKTSSTTWETGGTSPADDSKNTAVGKKYSFGSWGNDTTLQLRGTFKEDGSGLKAIHYAIFDAIPTSSDITKLVNGTLSVGGNVIVVSSFEPLKNETDAQRAENTKSIPYNKKTSGKASKDVLTSFNKDITGFFQTDKKNNYLVLVAEDNVGNRAADELAVTEGKDATTGENSGVEITNGDSKWNSTDHNTITKYYGLNYDITQPIVTTNVASEGLFTNGEGNDIVITGTAKDNDAGLSTISIVIDSEEGVRLYPAASDPAGTGVIYVPEEQKNTTYNWSYSIPASKFKNLTGNLANAKSFTATVTAKDLAGIGNTKDLAVATIKIDTKGPEVKVSTPAENAILAKSFEMSGTVFDGTGGAGVDTTKAMELYYTTSSTVAASKPVAGTSGTIGTDMASKWVAYTSSPTVTGQEWKYTLVNLTDIVQNKKVTDIYFSVSATDKSGSGNTDYSTPIKVTIDRKAPVYKESATRIGGKTVAQLTATPWFNSDTLVVSGTFEDFKEDGTTPAIGVETIFYQVNDGAIQYVATTDGTFNTNIGGFGANSTLTLYAQDKAGNVSEPKSYSIHVDTVRPEISEVTENDFKKSTLTNGNVDKELEFYVTDADSKIDTSASVVSVTAGAQTITSGTNGSLITVTPVSGETTKWKVTVKIGSTDLKKLSGNNSVLVTVTDKAGNTSLSKSIGTINVDTDKPVPTFASPAATSTVNKTITIEGKVTDPSNNAIKTVSLTAAGVTFTQVAANNANAGKHGYLTYANGQWSATLDTTKIYDGIEDEEITLTLKATDEADNESTAVTRKLTIDQKTDRPIVKFTNLTKDTSGAYILKFGTNSQLEGNVSDDDAGEKVVKLFKASDTNDNITISTAANGEVTISGCTGITTFDDVTGDYTFTPADTDDGSKKVYFYIVDNENEVFYTAYKAGETGVDSDQLKRPYQQFKQETKTDNSAKFEYKSDAQSPTITSTRILVTHTWESVKAETDAVNKYYTDAICTQKPITKDPVEENDPPKTTDDATVYEMLEASTGTVVGGTKIPEIRFLVIASDANGIKEMNLKYTPNGGSEVTITTSDSGSIFEETTDNTVAARWATPSVQISGTTTLPTGAVNVAVTATDQSGLFANQNPVFMVDNDGPAINVTSPKSTDEITGKLTISGFSTDEGNAGTDTIDFIVPTAAQRTAGNYASLADNLWGGNLHADSSPSAFRYDFDGDTTNENALFDIYTKEDTNHTTYGLNPNEYGIYTVPVIFRSKDKLGNISIKEYSITYNPDGDKPKTEITYPSASNYESATNQYVTLGGEIRVTGSVSIPSLTTTPERVYLQIAAGKTEAAFASGKTKAETDYGYTVKNITAVGTDIGKSITGITDTETNLAKTNWWGIEAIRSSNAWSISLNGNQELDPTGNTPNEIYIRACGVNAEGKMGSWSEPVCIHVDASAPNYTTKLYQFSGTPAVGAQTAEKDYVPGIYLKGQWYLGLHITDDEKVTVASVKEGGTSGTPLPASDITKIGEGTTAADLFIKLDKNATSTKTYTVTAHDEAEGNKHYIYPSYDINIDNTPPELEDIITGEGYPISMTKQRTSNNVITFGSTATDTGSGFSRLAYYFKRGTSIEVPIPTAENVNQKKWKVGSAYTGTLTKTYDDLYGVELTGTGAISGENTTFTSSGVGTNTFIRKGGIVKLAGTYHKIENVTANTVTVSGKIDSMVSADASDTKTAFFPAALIVDNTSAESSTWSGGINTISGDDGDGVTESVQKAGATWTWDTSIYAGELDDGEVTLVCVAFDVAENAVKSEKTFMLTNKTPRVSKLYLATDLNGDTKYSDNELGTSVITASGSKTVQKYYSALSSGSLQEKFTVYGNTDDENNSTTTSGITMRDKLGMAFEFISGYEGYGAGQGALKYKLSIGSSPITTAEEGTTGDLVAATNAKYDDNTANSVTKSIADNGLMSFEVLSSDVTGGTEDALNYLRVTLWDNANKRAGIKDGAATSKPYTNSNGDSANYYEYASFGAQWTAFNVPITLDLVDGVAPTVTINDPVALGTADAPTGHVDLHDDLPSSLDGSNEFDRDDKVSGKIKFTGTINDEKRITTITLDVNKNFSGKGISSATLATYSTGTGTFDNTTITPNGATGVTFTITDSSFSTATGHTVTWELEIDSEKVDAYAEADVLFTITANDGTNNGTANHQVDIVPYITSLKRETTLTDTHRSRLGKYQVVLGENLVIKGFNLPGTTADANNGIRLQKTGAEKGTTGETTIAIKTGDGITNSISTMTFAAPATSGYVKVETNGISSVNNFNSGNEIQGDYDTDEWTDDTYLSVWKNDEYFYFSNDPISPAMDRIPNGNGQYRLYGGWATNGSKFFASYPNTSGSGNTGNAPNPAYSGGTGFARNQSFGDPATFYDVIIDSSGNRYNMLLDCWQGNTDGWGQNFVVNRNGYYTHNNAGDTNATTSLTAATANYKHVIERMGNKVAPDNADSSDGFDEMFNQFLNPRLALYDGVAYLSYYDRYAKCLKYAALKPINSADNIEFKYSTEGMRNGGGDNSAGTFRKDGYTSGDCVVAGYDTTQSGGSKTNLDVGRWSSIAVDTTAKAPVIAYYDSTNKRLMLATASGNGNGTMTNHTTTAQKTSYPLNNNTPVLTGTAASTTEGDAWVRQEVKATDADSLLRLGQYVSMVTDAGGNLHIACNGAKGGNKLYYIYGAKGSYGNYTFTVTCVDAEGAGTWTDIQLEDPTKSGAAAKPVISYYDPSNDSSENAVKVAYLEGGVWDTMTAPLATNAVSDRITLALDVTDGANYTANGTTNNSKLAVGYVSSRFECVYLRKE